MIGPILSYGSSMLQQLQALLSSATNTTTNKTSDENNFIDRLMAQMDKNFSQIDSDSSGTITKDELTAFLTQKFSMHHHKHAQSSDTTSQTDQSQKIANLVNQIFAQLDPNNTGTIDKTQLTKALETIANQLAANDTNGIHRHHHHRHMTGQTQNVDQLTSQIFSALDTNKDGVVDPSELAAALTSTSGQNTTTNNSNVSFLQSLVGPSGFNGISSINSYQALTSSAQGNNDLNSILALLEQAI